MTRRRWAWPRRRRDLLAELHFWRNYALLRPFASSTRPPPTVTIPTQRTTSPADERWEVLLRAAYRHPRQRDRPSAE